MFQVTLLRGHKEPKVWNDFTETRAASRAYALNDLHGRSTIEQVSRGVWVVDASEYYNGKKGN